MASPQDITAIQTYFHNGLTQLKDEYDVKVEKWRPALRNVGSAFAMATARHAEVVKEAEDAKKARIEMYFSVLSLVCGAQLRWVGFYVKDSRAMANVSGNLKDYFAGGVEDGVKFLSEKGISGIKSVLPAHPPAFSKNPQRFQNDLENALDNSKNAVMSKIVEIAGIVHKQDAWAINLLKLTGGDLNRAKQSTNEYVSTLKHKWLDKCYYFANKPKNLTHVVDMSRAIETAIWAEWSKKNLYAYIDSYYSAMHKGIHHVQKYSNPEEPVLDRLEELRVIAPYDKGERATLKKKAEAKGWTFDQSHKAPVPNFGYQDDYSDVAKLLDWAKAHRPTPLGNIPGMAVN